MVRIHDLLHNKMGWSRLVCDDLDSALFMIPPLTHESNHQSQHLEILVFVQVLILALFIGILLGIFV